MGRPRAVSDDEILAAARRCFLEHGAGVSAGTIASELGVSHTTLFNRYGSKEALMIAALGPPEDLPWVAELERGPDARPIRTQLAAHAQAMAAFFEQLQAGLAVLHAAGIGRKQAWGRRKGPPPPLQAHRALVGWLRRAQEQERLGPCDVDLLASTVIGALNGWALNARLAGQAGEPPAERLVDLLWNGVRGRRE